MSDDRTRLIVEASSADIESLRGFQPFAVARRSDATERVFIRGNAATGTDVTLAKSEWLALPKEMDVSRAILALPVAAVLARWDTVSLELGEVAVWTVGSPLSDLAGGRRCGVAHVRPSSWGRSHRPITPGEFVDWGDADTAMSRLGSLIAGRPGFVAVDLSGRAEVIDILLETIPSFGRLLLARPAGDSLTIDYYKKVHRKGIVLSTTVLEPALAFDPIAGLIVRGQLTRAFDCCATGRPRPRFAIC